MFTIEDLTRVLGWSTLINFGILIITTLALFLMRGMISRIHGGMFGLDEPSLSRLYFQYLAFYKVLIIVFNLVPYLALRIVLSGT